MREIKFRVFDKGRYEWVHGPGNEVNLFGECILCGELLRRDSDDTRVKLDDLNDIVTLQFTDILDKNKAEIYEGDILYSRYDDTEEEKGFGEVWNEVIFQDGAFGWKGETTGGFHPFCDEPLSEAIVAGNIYQNPELLSKNESPAKLSEE